MLDLRFCLLLFFFYDLFKGVIHGSAIKEDTVLFQTKPPNLRPVFGENFEICHPKIFQTKAGFLMRSHFWKKISAFLNFELKILGLSEPSWVKWWLAVILEPGSIIRQFERILGNCSIFRRNSEYWNQVPVWPWSEKWIMEPKQTSERQIFDWFFY